MRLKFGWSMALSLTLLCQCAALARPALFSDLSLADAKAQAKKEGKLLVVDFTASWCPPCGEMDKTTWEDSAVVKWMHDNAVAIQIDVDKEQNLAKDLKILAMPSLVVFANQPEEADRVVGFYDSDDLLDWLKSIRSGVSGIERKQHELAVAQKQGKGAELEARFELARAQCSSAHYADAVENFVWIWQNISKANPQLSELRLTSLPSEISQLLAKYPAGKAPFAAIRDEAKSSNLVDWITLNQILGDDQKTFDWFDTAKTDPAQASKVMSVAFKLEPILIKAGRWADAAILIKQPLATLRSRFEIAREVAKTTGDVNPFPAEAGRIYACLLAAGRDAEAEQVAQESLRLENLPEVKEALVFTAADARQLKPAVKKRLDEMDATKSDASGYFKRGVVYWQLKILDKANADFDKAIELMPIESGYYDARESVNCELKHFDKAISDANHVIEIYPESSRAYVSRGFVYMKQKNDALALKDFEKAIELNPDDVLALINESAVYARQGKYQQSFEAADKAVKRDASNAGGLCNRGEAAYKMARYDQALSDLTKSIELGKALCGGENFYYRARVYEALGKTELAKADRQSAIELGFTPETPD